MPITAPRPQRAVRNFQISPLRFSRAFIRALGLIKKAAAQVNMDLGLLCRRTWARRSSAAAQAVADGKHDDQFVARHLPDRQRHLDEHERQRGDRRSRQRAAHGAFAAARPPSIPTTP